MQRAASPTAGTDGVSVSDRGTGTPVLVLHGTPGGRATAEVMARFLPSDGFRVLAVARPGYAGTTLPAGGGSLDDEVDRYAALLDRLDTGPVSVLAWSGGGPAAYRLAVRHPERVRSLVVSAGLSGRWVPPRASFAEWVVTRTTVGAALADLAAHVAPRLVVGATEAGVSSLRGAALRAHVDGVVRDPVRRAAVLGLASSGNAAGAARAGWDNDVRVLGAVDDLELGSVAAPTLLLHGDADTDVAPAHSARAAAAVPDAELVTLPGGTHFALWSHRDAARVQDRVRRHLAGAPAA